MRFLENLDSGLGAVVVANTGFALELYERLRAEPGNVFYSPFSVSMVLTMALAGARGETAAQMTRTLGYAELGEDLFPVLKGLERQFEKVGSGDRLTLKTANSLWHQESDPFLPDFLQAIRRIGSAEIRPVDFATAKEEACRAINEWVSRKTENRIQEVIDPAGVNALTRLVLMNAIYFKGDWAEQFDAKLTRDEQFWIAPDQSVSVPLMRHREAPEFAYGESADVQFVELPYVGGQLTMLVVLPKPGCRLEELEEQLTTARLLEWDRLLAHCEVEVFLPRFQTKTVLNLGDHLAAMGMPEAFDPERADFSGMDGRKNWLFVQQVLQQAFVEVNEEGTEAAAATAMMYFAGTIQEAPRRATFRADRPFLFFIRDYLSGSILFMGRMADPRVQR